MARDYLKEYSKDFLEKAKRFLDIAKTCLDKFPVESAFNATQAIINANDAFTVFTLQKRASMDHREAVILDMEAASKIGMDKSKLSIVNEALDARSVTGYDVKKVPNSTECSILVKRAERFVILIESLIKE